MSDSKKYATEHEEGGKDSSPSPPAAQQKGIKRHCARFWWIYLLTFVILAILIPILIIFVAIPKIAQKKLDEATLTLDGIHITETTPNSLTMSLNSTITASSSIHADVFPFVGIMYLEDLPAHTPFAHLDFPATTTADIQTVNVTQNLNINDSSLAALAEFNGWLIANKTVRVTVEGETKVKVKGLNKKYGVTFKKTLDVAGLDNFKGLKVSDATISITPNDNGDNFVGFVDVPNPSVFLLEVGNATFNTFFESVLVGPTRLDNMILHPNQVNNVSMRAAISQIPIITANNQRPYCETGMFPFEMVGVNVTNGGANLTYFGEGLATTTQEVDIQIGEFLQRDLNITATCGDEE